MFREAQKRLLAGLFIVLLASVVANAQETNHADVSSVNIFKSFTHCFSREGRKDWRMQYGASYSLGFPYTQEMATVGIRMDDKREWGLALVHTDLYIDADPASEYYLSLQLHNKHYWFLSQRHRSSFFFEGSFGVCWCYKDTCDESRSYDDGSRNDEGLVGPIMELRLGFDFPIHRKLHGNLGFELHEGMGVFLGINF